MRQASRLPVKAKGSIMSDSNTPTTPARKTREAVAKKEYRNAAGVSVDIDEDAVSLYYESLADKKSTLIEVGKLAPEVQLMLALFGASTLATNVATQNRSAEPSEQLPSDVDAVNTRFGRMDVNNWGIKAPAGRVMIDVDILAESIVELNFAPPDLEAFKAELRTNDSLRSELRNNPQVLPIYDRKITEKKLAAASAAPAKSLADLLAGFKPAA